MSSPSTVTTAVAPLTTVFTPPASCLNNIYVAEFGNTNFFGLGTPCGLQDDSCLPSQSIDDAGAAATITSLQPFLYTPGLFCPSGYYTATTTALSPSITGAACCPSGLAPSGVVCVGTPDSPLTATGCDNLATTFTTTAGASAFTVSAALVVLAFQSSDLTLTNAATSSVASVKTSATPTIASNATSSNHTVVGTGSSLPTIQISNTPLTASITKATSTSGASRNWRNMLTLGGLAAVAIAALC